jgi:hypothetical protein
MDMDELIAWAVSKNCGPRRQTGSCEHEACDENDRAIAVLRSAIKFEGTDAAGQRVSGWLIPDA